MSVEIEVISRIICSEMKTHINFTEMPKKYMVFLNVSETVSISKVRCIFKNKDGVLSLDNSETYCAMNDPVFCINKLFGIMDADKLKALIGLNNCIAILFPENLKECQTILLKKHHEII